MTARKRLPMMIAVLGLAAGCSQPEPGVAPAAEATASKWVTPPRIDGVRRSAGALTVSGQTSPGARVVLRGGDGSAFAASADDSGRFEIRIGAADHDLSLIPEVQTGEDAAPAPERLLILGGADGPVVMLAAGVAGRRLDGAGALGAVDSEGRMLALSGRAPAGQTVRITLNGGSGMTVLAGADGRWTAVAGPAGGPVRLGVGARVYDYPGEAGAGPVAARAGAGWRLAWMSSSGGRQVTWLPDAGE